MFGINESYKYSLDLTLRTLQSEKLLADRTR